MGQFLIALTFGGFVHWLDDVNGVGGLVSCLEADGGASGLVSGLEVVGMFRWVLVGLVQ